VCCGVSTWETSKPARQVSPRVKRAEPGHVTSPLATAPRRGQAGVATSSSSISSRQYPSQCDRRKRNAASSVCPTANCRASCPCIENVPLAGPTVNPPQARLPVVPFRAHLSPPGEPQPFGRERGILEPGPDRPQPLQRARKVVADRLGLQIPVDPQHRL